MADTKKKRRSLLMFSSRSSHADEALTLSLPPSPVEARIPDHYDASPTMTSESSSPTTRPRLLSKPHRNSVFGSLRSLHSWDEDEKLLAKIDSKASSIHGDGDSPTRGLFGDHVKRAAEVQISGNSVFRKKTQYIVLTESHIIRFKNQAKAAEMFPIIPHNSSKSSNFRSNSGSNTSHFPSSSSFADLQALPTMEITQGVPLDEVVAVYRVEDGRPFFTLEVAHADEKGRRSSTLQLNFSGPREAELWQQAIREQATLRRSLVSQSYGRSTLEYLAGILTKEGDYDPLHFRVFKVVQRTPVRSAANRVSTEDLAKGASVCYLIIGINRVHLIPLPFLTNKKSSFTSLSDIESPSSFGITNLTSVKLRPSGDSFELYFRTPLKNPHVASLASYDTESIALWLRYAYEYLCPEWVVQPFVFDVPPGVEDRMDPPIFANEENNCFDRTLMAFCAAFEVDVSRISYSVDYAGDDAPCFRVLPPSSGTTYSALELLAIFRALRYNESFTTLSFADVDLGPLRTVFDPFGASDDSICGRNGRIIDFPGHGSLSVFQQELRALALKSRKLRRLDFTNSLPSLMRRDDLSSGIPEALTPLCKKSLTNVDWITLNGVRLTEHDIDFLVDAASERQCHLRALEVGRCGLSVHDVDVLLSTLGIHDNTMEVIDISGSQGRFSPELFQRAIGSFTRIQRLDLTRIQKTAGPEPLVAPEILLTWRLQSLRLNGTTLNEQSVDTVAAYLASPKSDLLRELSIDQCGITGKELAIMLRSLSRDNGQPRQIHISANENRLGQESSHLCRCIAQNHAPASLSMRMIDFAKEYQFRELVFALTKNTTITRLDISQASLPYDATMETCEALKDMFAKNHTLEDLDISGDVAHLDTARFGIGLNIALLGLERNDALKSLRIENQNLGLQGANTLAGVIEKNTCLAEIHCAHNDIQLQSFTVLVNALKKNKSLLFLPAQEHDRAKSIEKLREEFNMHDRTDEPKSPRTGALKKGMHVVAAVSRHRRQSSALSTASHHSFSQQDLNDAIAALQDKWDIQTARLQQYLLRNYQLASGMTWEQLDKSVCEGLSRPETADPLSRMLAKLQTSGFATADDGMGTAKSNAHDTVEMLNEKTTTIREHPPFVFTLPED